MIEKDIGPVGTMGFARYEKQSGVAPEDIVAAALTWQERFLAHQDGVAFHALLGNLRGGFADVMFARDAAAFAAMASRFPDDVSSKQFLALLEPSSIRLCQSAILKDNLRPPRDFSCVEFGTFRLAPGNGAAGDSVRKASDHIEATYLRSSTNTRQHFVGRVDDQTFCEVVFGRTLAETRRTCLGYVGNPDCEPLLRLFAPQTVELDFWYLLA